MSLRKQLLYQNKNLSYSVIGTGNTVVLLHGFGEDGAIWETQYAAFPEHQLIIPDVPGSGASEEISDMSMEGLAAAIKAILEAENVTKATLLGHSMGGYITLAFVEAYPNMVVGFGLVHSTAFADTEEKRETRKKGIEFIESHGAAAFLKTITPALYAPQTLLQRPDLIEQHIEQAQRFKNAPVISYCKSMMKRPDRTAVLKQTNLPVFFLLGLHDTTVLPADALQQCHLPQLSYIHLLENSGHMGFREESQVANKHILEFLSLIQS